MSTRRNPEHTKDYDAPAVGPNPVVVYAADGVTVLRIISSAALAKRARVTGQESPQMSPRAYLPTAKRAAGSMKLLGTRSWA